MSSFDEMVDRVEEAPPRIVDVSVPFDPDTAHRHEQLEQELEQLLRRPGGSISDRGPSQVADDIAELIDTAQTLDFSFQTVGAKRWSQLIATHPPSKQERERGRDVADRFWPAAMAASCVAPEGANEDGFTKLWSKLSDGQWQKLVSACRQANAEDHDIRPSQAAFALLSGRRQKSDSQSI